MANVTDGPETNLITKAQLAKAREVDFVLRFGENVKQLIQVLGVTRKIAKEAGSTLAYYKVTGTLADGTVEEGAIIPLSQYKNEKVAIDNLTFKKYRKATTIEAIAERGYNQAEVETKNKMLLDVQKGVKSDFFSVLGQGTGTAQGAGLQATLAAMWAQLQIKFEDNDIEAVYFVNPEDIGDYLGKAPITLQTAFGMSYIENFLGLGTVIVTSAVTKNTVYATAKENIVLYYVPVNGADIGEAFTFTSDQTGLIGIHEGQNYERLTNEDVVVSALRFFPERIDGVIKGTIAGA